MRLLRLLFCLTLLTAAFPAVAAETCCRCTVAGATDTTCLNVVNPPRGTTQKETCQNAPTTYKLDGWSCEWLDASQCARVGSGAGICQQGPIGVHDLADNATEGEAIGTASKPPTPAIIPNLNVPIPGFAFTGSEATSESSSLLAQYVAAGYRYGISITAVAATVMFIFGAFQYLVGSAIPSVNNGKRIMQEAILGMLLVFGANLILRTVNPDTLSLKALNVTSIDPQTFGADTEVIPSKEQGASMTLASGGSIVFPTAICRGDECAQYCEGSTSKKPIPEIENGMAKKEALVPVTIGQGLKSSGTKLMRPEAAEALTRAGSIAHNFPGGPYELIVGETFRSLEKQLDAACKILNGNTLREGAVASPGASPHGMGIAVDVSLYRNGVGLIVPTFPLSAQGEKLSQRHAETLEQIMVEAGFTHYCPEVWHFDFGRPETTEIRKKCPWPPIVPQR